MGGMEREDGAGRTRRLGDAPPTAPQAGARAELDERPPSLARYDVRGRLGRGGQGVVWRVFDRELDREVALKTLKVRGDRATESFLAEARAAARLEHPHVVPIHDAGVLDDGRPFYTMRLVEGATLERVLRERASGAEGEWTLVRLVQVVQQACRALAFAHEHGVLHRDVKPSNVMLGPMGEVLLVDWGIAKSTGPGSGQTSAGVVKGTIAYMSPEQARGAELDGRSDLYSVGVVLFEILSRRLPFEGDNEADRLASLLRDPSPRPEEVAPRGALVPPELSALVVRLLSKDPAQRLASARDVDAELQAFLEGVRDRERREAAADAASREAAAALELHAALAETARTARDEAARLEREHPTWQPLPEKRPLLDARRRAAEAEAGARLAFLRAANLLTDALAHVPDHARARGRLAELFWARFVAAEDEGDAVLAETFRSLVERFHDGRYARELEGTGELVLEVAPGEAEVDVHPQVERDLVLVDGPPLRLGRGGAFRVELPMGSHVVVARAPGHVELRHPVLVSRCGRPEARLRLPREGELPEGFVFVPGATVTLGGDALAVNSWPRREVTLADFAIARHPVTFGEYCAFLDAVALGGAVRDELVPRLPSGAPLCERAVATGRFAFVARTPQPPAFAAREGWSDFARLPVMALTRGAAEAYAAWRGRADGRAYRLPTAEEREYVARGADRRIFPWGNSFDASLCHVRVSMPGEPDVAPVGAFEGDTSVHGVRDLAGLVHEWTSSWFDEGHGLAELRGGAYHVGPATARGAWRGASVATFAAPQVGFRLALGLRPA